MQIQLVMVVTYCVMSMRQSGLSSNLQGCVCDSGMIGREKVKTDVLDDICMEREENVADFA